MDHGRNLLEQLQSHRRVMRSVCSRLDAMADTLSFVGMDKMAERISEEMMEISQSTKALVDAYDDNLNAEYRKTQENIGGILTILLDNCDKAAKVK